MKNVNKIPISKQQAQDKHIYLDNSFKDTLRYLTDQLTRLQQEEHLSEELVKEVEGLERDVRMLKDSLYVSFITLLKQGYQFPK